MAAASTFGSWQVDGLSMPELAVARLSVDRRCPGAARGAPEEASCRQFRANSHPAARLRCTYSDEGAVAIQVLVTERGRSLSTPTLSVLVPDIDEVETVAGAFARAMVVDFQADAEVVVVDDGGRGGTAAVHASLAQAAPRTAGGDDRRPGVRPRSALEMRRELMPVEAP